MDMQKLYPAPILSLLDKTFKTVHYGLTKNVDKIQPGQTVGVLFSMEDAQGDCRGRRFPVTFFRAEREFAISEIVSVIRTAEHRSIAGVLAKILSITNTFGSLLSLDGNEHIDAGFVLIFEHDKSIIEQIRWAPYGEKLQAWMGTAPVEDAEFYPVIRPKVQAPAAVEPSVVSTDNAI